MPMLKRKKNHFATPCNLLLNCIYFMKFVIKKNNTHTKESLLKLIFLFQVTNVPLQIDVRLQLNLQVPR